MMRASNILRDFKPDVVVGVGGYASGPLLYAAGNRKIPYVIQEQNSYAGITNKLLSRKAAKICVAFSGMEKFFPSDKILFTGNPIRKDSVDIQGKRFEGLSYYELSENKKTILVIGGSLGSLTLNNSVLANLEKIKSHNIQLIWQCGNYYHSSLNEQLSESDLAGVKLLPFLQRMDLAYAAADVIISRAGAGTIAELCVVAKPVILVPSPNVAEDHQSVNAKSLEVKDAALIVRDIDAKERLMDTAIELVRDEKRCNELSANIQQMAIIDADDVIAKEVLTLAGGLI